MTALTSPSEISHPSATPWANGCPYQLIQLSEQTWRKGPNRTESGLEAIQAGSSTSIVQKNKSSCWYFPLAPRSSCIYGQLEKLEWDVLRAHLPSSKGGTANGLFLLSLSNLLATPSSLKCFLYMTPVTLHSSGVTDILLATSFQSPQLIPLSYMLWCLPHFSFCVSTLPALFSTTLKKNI